MQVTKEKTSKKATKKPSKKELKAKADEKAKRLEETRAKKLADALKKKREEKQRQEAEVVQARARQAIKNSIASKSLFDDDEETESEDIYDSGFEDGFQGDDDSSGLSSSFFGEPLASHATGLTPGLDVFRSCEKICSQSQDFPKFKIFKDGTYIALKQWPYSWEKLQEEYGAGMFKVQGIRASNGTVIKTEVLMIGEDTSKKHEVVEQKEEKTPQAATPFSDPLALLTYLRQVQADEAAKARQDMKLQVESSKGTNELIIAMMQTQQQQASQGLLTLQQSIVDMQKTNFEMMNKQAEATSKMIEKLSEKLETKKEQFGPLELLKIIKDAEDSGFKKFQQLQELVLAQQPDNEPEEKESMTDTIIKSALPALSTLITNSAQQQPPRQALPQPLPQHQRPAPQATVSSQRRQPHDVRRDAPRGDVQKAGTQAPTKVETNREGHGEAKPNVVPTKQEKIARPGLERADLGPSNVDTQGQLKQNVEAKVESSVVEEQIKTIALPIIADKLINQGSPVFCAHDVLQALYGSGITREMVLKHWSFEKLIKLARELQIPEIADPWFKEFFDEIRTTRHSSESVNATL